MDEWVKWLIGLGFAVVSAAGGWLSSALNKHSTRIDELHSRINDVRDQYVRRAEYLENLSRFEREIEALRGDIKAFQALLLDRLPPKK